MTYIIVKTFIVVLPHRWPRIWGELKYKWRVFTDSGGSRSVGPFTLWGRPNTGVRTTFQEIRKKIYYIVNQLSGRGGKSSQ